MRKLEFNKKLDEEYLSKDKINVKFDITDDHVIVNSENTSFLYHIKSEKVKQEDILDLYSQIVKKCREQGVKIHYNNRYKKSIIDNWGFYTDTYKEYLKDFKNLISIAKKVEKRGIHYGCSDDYVLNEGHRMIEKLNSYFWGGQIIYYVKHVKNELEKLNHQLDFYSKSDKSKITDIYL